MVIVLWPESFAAAEVQKWDMVFLEELLEGGIPRGQGNGKRGPFAFREVLHCRNERKGGHLRRMRVWSQEVFVGPKHQPGEIRLE